MDWSKKVRVDPIPRPANPRALSMVFISILNINESTNSQHSEKQAAAKVRSAMGSTMLFAM